MQLIQRIQAIGTIIIRGLSDKLSYRCFWKYRGNWLTLLRRVIYIIQQKTIFELSFDIWVSFQESKSQENQYIVTSEIASGFWKYIRPFIIFFKKMKNSRYKLCHNPKLNKYNTSLFGEVFYVVQNLLLFKA